MVLPTPPLPEVMTTTRGVSPANSGFLFHWRTERTVNGDEEEGLGNLGFGEMGLWKGLKEVGGCGAVWKKEELGLVVGRNRRESIAVENEVRLRRRVLGVDEELKLHFS